jgi:hypothetical protein
MRFNPRGKKGLGTFLGTVKVTVPTYLRSKVLWYNLMNRLAANSAVHDSTPIIRSS